MLGILGGMEHLHSRNVVHRDLKPDNILLQGNFPRIKDFETTFRESVALIQRHAHVNYSCVRSIIYNDVFSKGLSGSVHGLPQVD